MPPQALYSPQEIVAAGEALEAGQGDPVSLWAIHRALGGRDRSNRVGAVWRVRVGLRNVAVVGPVPAPNGSGADDAPAADDDGRQAARRTSGGRSSSTVAAVEDPEGEPSPLHLDEAAGEHLPI